MYLRRWRVKLCNLWNDKSVTMLWRIVSLLLLVLLVANLRMMMKSPDTQETGSRGAKKLKGLKCEPVRLSNPSFEGKGGWTATGKQGYSIVSESKYNGKKAIKIINGGAKQSVHFPQGVRKFVFSAFSRNTGVIRGKMSPNYSIWCDTKTSDGKWTYGHHTKFMMKSVGGSYNWHERKLQYQAKKDITEVVCSLIFRNYGSGRAYFDNVRMWIFPPGVEFDDCKYTYLM